MTTNLQLTPEEIEAALVWALAKKAKDAKKTKAPKRTGGLSLGSVGVRIEDDENGSRRERWYFTTWYKGRHLTRLGGDTAAEAEAALIEYVREVESEPRWTAPVRRPSADIEVQDLNRTMDHLRFPWCPRCGSATTADFVTYCECPSCGWHEWPRRGWRIVSPRSERITEWDSVAYSGRRMWLGGFFSRLIGEPEIVSGCVTRSAWGRDVEYWTKGWGVADELECPEKLANYTHSTPRHRFELHVDRERANRRLELMRSETPRPKDGLRDWAKLAGRVWN